MDYLAIYNRLIEKAKSENRKRNTGVYYEGHHIIPKCMGGEGRTKDLNHPNIVLLTAKEHYMAHRLLVLIYPDNKSLKYALWCMMHGFQHKTDRYICSSRIYERLKQESSSMISNYLKGTSKAEFKAKKSLEVKVKLPRHLTDEHKKKISEANKNKKRTEEHKKKISAALKGRKISQEILDKKKGRIPWNKNKKLTEEEYQNRLIKFRATLALKKTKNASTSASYITNPNSKIAEE